MLQCLEIDYSGYGMDELGIIKAIIRLNPQLKIFRLWTYDLSVQDMWQFIDENLPMLECLEMDGFFQYEEYSEYDKTRSWSLFVLNFFPSQL